MSASFYRPTDLAIYQPLKFFLILGIPFGFSLILDIRWLVLFAVLRTAAKPYCGICSDLDWLALDLWSHCGPGRLDLSCEDIQVE
jgi:hypothetical protein